MDKEVHQMNDDTQEWFDYFMETYTKEDMIIKYIAVVRELNARGVTKWSIM